MVTILENLSISSPGLFHDVGKFMLPAGILRKPGKLTPDEFEIVKTHTTEGFHLLGRYNSIPEPVKNTVSMDKFLIFESFRML